MSPTQQVFNMAYITATEIAFEVGVSRESVYKKRLKQALPNPISVGDGIIYIWKREEIRPHIDAWKQDLLERRASTA